MEPTPGQKFREALKTEQPLQLVGAINAYTALLAEHAGFKALYLSGAGVANASYGLPDLGMTTLDNVLEDVHRVTRATKLPLLVDVDTGFHDPAHTVKHMIAAGAAAIQIEDQVDQKRCGHRPNKQLIPVDEMVDRIKAAVAGRSYKEFVIMARTDAVASEGMNAAFDRMQAYVKAGADMVFPEAITSLEHYRQIAQIVNAPILANITEFGKTPLFTLEQLKAAHVAIALYPLTAFRAMSAAAEQAYTTLRREGTQASLIDQMQTRDELYEHLDYYRYEQRIDREHGNE